MEHTIALIQVSKHDSTRFYVDYSSLKQCLEGGWRCAFSLVQHWGAVTSSFTCSSITSRTQKNTTQPFVPQFHAKPCAKPSGMLFGGCTL
jgi:hypothetical protein